MSYRLRSDIDLGDMDILCIDEIEKIQNVIRITEVDKDSLENH